MSQPNAVVLLERPFPLDLQYLIEKLAECYPALPCEVVGAPSTGGSPSIRCGGRSVILTSVDAPIPNDDALWQRTALIWPDARQAAARHRAHLIVSIQEAGASKLEGARLTTAVVGVISALPDACAIIWEGKIGRSPQMWREMSQRSFAPYPHYPITLWVDILPFKSGQSAGALTVGLFLFIGREIEFDLPGMALASLIERVFQLASLLIERGGVIADNQTFRISDTEQVMVFHDVSRFNGSPVLRVGPAARSGSFKHYPVISPAMARDHPLLVLLSQVGLFDAASSANQVQLQPATYDSEERLATYDAGVSGALSKMQATDAYVVAAKNARAALARGDTNTAKAALRPFAEDVSKLQAALQHALTHGAVFMFTPKQTPTKLS
jgi:hypothetical protein